MPYKEVKKSYIYGMLKRFTDVVLSILLLFLFSPILLIVVTAIKIDSRGPIFADTPERVGKNGRSFKMYKFRSMIENAHDLLRTDPEFATLYNMYKKNSYKLQNDPRITKVGHFIRKYSLDELPQFVN